ncbi:MAG: DUF4416 family protein [Planctomycetaceae bacterium]|nr:DUF4416 family protein [Planctomycetaceae bacterium]
MGVLMPPAPVILFCAIYGNKATSLAWAREKLVAKWGKLALTSAELPFNETQYYEASMGRNLQKQLLAFADLHPPESLPQWKLESNELEAEFQALGGHDVARAVNIDPGYVTLAKLVLATTKDRDHRLYIGQGIFAEVTLHFKHGRWQHDRWTYADYQRPEYHEFLTQCRELLKVKLKFQ